MAGIYIHIPFCKKRCIYCDFYSTTLDTTWRKQYINALCKEIKLRKDYLGDATIETIYFGGGTPSQLNTDELKRITDTLKDSFSLNSCKEITLEANPDDITPSYLKKLRTLPINRLSLGIQSFDDTMLKRLNRRHSAQEAVNAVKLCQDAGYKNISIDLMYGLPGENLVQWERDIQQAIELHPQHISAYHLIYEEGTVLWKMREQHQVSEADEDLSLTFFSTLIEQLTKAGFEHYEISNFSLPQYVSKHNSGYWEGIPYLGLGPSAHSFDGKERGWNISDIKQYIKAIEKESPSFEIEPSTQNTQYNDFIVTALRTAKGLNLVHLKNRFGEELYKHCLSCATPYLKQGTLQREKERLFVSRQGIFISDRIMSDLLYVED